MPGRRRTGRSAPTPPGGPSDVRAPSAPEMVRENATPLAERSQRQVTGGEARAPVTVHFKSPDPLRFRLEPPRRRAPTQGRPRPIGRPPPDVQGPGSIED